MSALERAGKVPFPVFTMIMDICNGLVGSLAQAAQISLNKAMVKVTILDYISIQRLIYGHYSQLVKPRDHGSLDYKIVTACKAVEDPNLAPEVLKIIPSTSFLLDYPMDKYSEITGFKPGGGYTPGRLDPSLADGLISTSLLDMFRSIGTPDNSPSFEGSLPDTSFKNIEVKVSAETPILDYIINELFEDEIRHSELSFFTSEDDVTDKKLFLRSKPSKAMEAAIRTYSQLIPKYSVEMDLSILKAMNAKGIGNGSAIVRQRL